ncbi:MAG: endolytic transglycosylase MltG [Zoogloeaceae bacterium]|jgi:UPF0755 protein|nr:endolytic transglycosylase MltG [Zoogloeaceae bacterium]
MARRFVRFLLALLFFALLLGAGGVGGLYFWLARPLSMGAAEAVEFRVLPGMGARGVARALNAAGVEMEENLLALAMRLSGQKVIQAGTYSIQPGITPRQLLQMMAQGKVVQVEVRLIEGWTFREWRQRLRGHPGLEAATEGLSEAEIMARIGLAGQMPEGMFFPDTYRVDKYSSDLALFARAARAMRDHLAREWAARAEGLPYRNSYEALIMASIVEKETGLEEDRTMVAGVFINRLRIGMRLQTDPAVIYGMREAFDGNLRKADLLADTPYNTYTRAGLPPTPIAMPSLASLRAALHPEPTRALYFVAKGDGSSHFSTTLVEHNEAVNRYQRRRR